VFKAAVLLANFYGIICTREEREERGGIGEYIKRERKKGVQTGMIEYQLKVL